GRVGTAHEADRSARRSSALEMFLRRTNVGEVDPGTRSALEDRSFFAVPVEDAVHRVLDREYETRCGLGRYAFHADVEPHGRVERGALGEEDELQLVAERCALVL